MSLAVLARKTRTIKSKNRSSNTSSKKTNTPHIGYNNYLSRKNNSANRPSGLTCCTNNKVKVIVKTTDTKSASDKINKQKMHIISCNKEDIIASSSHIERVRSRVKTCINTLMDGPASVVGTLRWALLNWWPTTERPIKGIQFMKKGKYAKYGRIERWNTHKVTDFSDLISSVQKEMKRLGMIPILDPRDFNEYISNWDTSNVIDMSYMFSALSSDATKTHKFNQDISKWDVRNVKNMEGMFSSFENNPEDPGFEFNRDIRKWNVSKVENMKKMFFNAIKFSQNLRQWTSNGYGLKSDVNTENMFGDPTQGVSKLKIREKYSLLPTTPKTEKDIWVRYWSDPLYDDPRDGLTISDAVDLWFSDPDNFSSTGKYRDYGTIGDWNTNKVTDMSGLFSGRDMKNIDISDWDVGEVTDMSETFKNTKNLDISTLHEWQIGTGVPVTGMFDGAKGIPDQYSDVIQPDNGTPDVSKLFKKNKAIVNGDSNSVDKLGIHAAVDLWMKDPDVFNKLGKYGEYGSIDKWNTILVTDMSRLFKDNDNFNKNISEWDVSNVETMKSMFEGAKKFYVDLRKWDVGKVEKMSETFKWADMIYKKLYDNDNEPKPNIESDGTTNKDDWRKLKWPVAILKDGPKERVGSLRWALHEWSTDKSLFNTLGDYEDYGTIEEWNTSIITDMSGLFKDKDSFNEDISEWDVGEVKYMSSMFEGAADFNQDISGWNVSNAKDMSSMFEGASAFNKDISNWERAAADGAPVSTLVNVATMESMFKDAKAFNQNIGNWNTENVNNMSHMFDGALVFNKSINSWNVSNVITMASMFEGASAFNQNISNWERGKYDDGITVKLASTLGNVTDMSGMFKNATQFNNGGSEGIDEWDVSNVETMKSMFEGATDFNQGVNPGWDVGKVENMSGMFKDAANFNKKVNAWNVEKVEDMSGMFNGASKFNQPLHNWDVENVNHMGSMFKNAPNFNQDISNWDVSKVKNMTKMFAIENADKPGSFNQNLSHWGSNTFDGNVVYTGIFSSNGTHNHKLVTDHFAEDDLSSEGTPAKKWHDLNWPVKKLTDGESGVVGSLRWAVKKWFESADPESKFRPFETLGKYREYGSIERWDTKDITNMADLFKDKDSFNENISDWNTGNVKTMSGMFKNAIMFNKDISKWNVTNVGLMLEMFMGAKNFNQDISNWERDEEQDEDGNIVKPKSTLGNVREMAGMFWGATRFNNGSVTMHPHATNHPLNNWNTPSLWNMEWMFRDAIEFNQDISEWNIQPQQQANRPTRMTGMFLGAKKFNQDISNWNVSRVKNMSQLFKNAESFNQNISNWEREPKTDTDDNIVEPASTLGNVTHMTEMFMGASDFNKPVNNWNTEKVEDMSMLFYRAQFFNQQMDKWNVSAVKNMSGMFGFAVNFNNAGISLNDWKTENVDNMSGMFLSAFRFNQNISNWETGKVKNMASMFEGFNYVELQYLLSPPTENEGASSARALRRKLFMKRLLNDTEYALFEEYWDWENTKGSSSPPAFVFLKFAKLLLNSTVFNIYNDAYEKMKTIGSSESKSISEGETAVYNYFLNEKETSHPLAYDYGIIFNQNISKWNVSKVKNMEKMFMYANNFNRNLYDWDVGNVTNMNSMFYMRYNSSLFVRLSNNGDSSNKERQIISASGTPFGYTPGISVDKWKKLYWSLIIPLTDGASGTIGSLKWAVNEWFKNKVSFNMDYKNPDGTIGGYRDYGTIEEWNTSIITDMSELFKDNKAFNKNISNWDVSNVTTMARMFEGAAVFNQDISNWEREQQFGTIIKPATTLANVENMSHMFKDAKAFNQNIGNWNTENVNNMSHMFDGALVFNKSINSWTVSNVITMASMFKDAKAFNQNIGNWNTENVNNMSHMFDGAFVFNKSINSWTVSNVITMASMFKDAKAFNQNIGTWNTENVDNMSHMFDGALVFNKSINSWSVNNVKTTEYMFSNAQEFNNGSASLNTWQFNSNTNYEGMFKDARLFNQPINSWLNSAPNNIENDDKISFKDMFKDALVFNQNLTDWVVENVKDMSGMFYRAMSFNNGLRGPPEGLKEADPVGNIKGWIYEGYDENNKSNKIPISKWKWNVQNVETMSHMFFGAWAFNQTLSHWNYGNSLKDTSYMFYNAITFNNGYEYGVMNPPRHPDVGEANVLGGSTFATAEIITQDYKEEEISGNGSGYLFVGWFESVENASHMFNQAYSFNSNIFFAYLKLGVITNLDYMFANAISFETGFLEGYFADEPREATDEPTGFISAVLDLRIEVGTPEYEQRLRDGFPTYKNILLFSTGFTRNITNPSRAFKTSTVVFTPKEITDQTNLIDASAKTAGINITNLAENVTTSIVDTLISYATNIFTGLFR